MDDTKQNGTVIEKQDKNPPELISDLRSGLLHVPRVISQCSGIRINGRRIKSIIFTTDVALVMNNNADAVLAVYPFTPHPAIFQAIASVASVPVFAGVGGGTTSGMRSAQMATFAEAHGCFGVVVNAPTSLETIVLLKKVLDIPIVCTVVSELMDVEARLQAGVTIINVSGGSKTAALVHTLRQKYPQLPIIATGGPDESTILQTIEAGANAITWTPPSAAEIFKEKMVIYRQKTLENYQENHQLY